MNEEEGCRNEVVEISVLRKRKSRPRYATAPPTYVFFRYERACYLTTAVLHSVVFKHERVKAGVSQIRFISFTFSTRPPTHPSF